MTKKLVPLEYEKHKGFKVKSRNHFRDFASENLLPLTVNEFASASSSFPLVFIKHGKTGEFKSVAMTAFEARQNLYCANDNSEWEGVYIPNVIQREPFSLGPDPKQDNALVVYLDENSELLSSNEGHAIFDKNQKESSFFKGVHKQLSDYYQSEITSQTFIQTLIAKKLVKEIELAIHFDSERSKRVKGLYTIDEEALAELTEQDILSFFQKGYLVPIYAMLNSITQFNRLLRMHNQSMEEKVSQLKMHVAQEEYL